MRVNGNNIDIIQKRLQSDGIRKQRAFVHTRRRKHAPHGYFVIEFLMSRKTMRRQNLIHLIPDRRASTIRINVVASQLFKRYHIASGKRTSLANPYDKLMRHNGIKAQLRFSRLLCRKDDVVFIFFQTLDKRQRKALGNLHLNRIADLLAIRAKKGREIIAHNST